jgi:hypothetical protein
MDKETLIGVAGAVATALCAWFYPPSIPGIFLGAISSVAMMMTYHNMTPKVKGIICKYRILVDIGLAFIVPLWFGNFTATAVMAAAVNSVLVSLLLKHESNTLGIA